MGSASRKTRIYSEDGQNIVLKCTIKKNPEGDPEVLKHPPVTKTDHYPILQEELEAAVEIT